MRANSPSVGPALVFPALGAMILAVAVMALAGCQKKPCDGHINAAWNHDGRWDFLGELPVGPKGAVCRAGTEFLEADLFAAPSEVEPLKARWVAWLEEAGWQRELDGSWNARGRERQRSGFVGYFGKDERTIALNVRERFGSVAARLDLLERAPRLPFDQAVIERGAARVEKVKQAIATWTPESTKACDEETLRARRGDRSPPLALFDRVGLGLVGKDEGQVLRRLALTDRRVEGRKPRRDDSTERYQAEKQSFGRARVLERSPLVVVFHLRADDVTAPQVLGAPRIEDGRKITTFRSGDVAGHALVVDADVSDVVCHVPVHAKNMVQFDALLDDPEGILWADLAVQIGEAVDTALARFPSMADFARRTRILSEQGPPAP